MYFSKLLIYFNLISELVQKIVLWISPSVAQKNYDIVIKKKATKWLQKFGVIKMGKSLREAEANKKTQLSGNSAFYWTQSGYL